MAVQPDGKIVEVGYRARSRFAPLVARLNGDGSLDSSFGAGGVQRLRGAHRDGIYNTFFHDVAIQPSGRIVVVGATDEHEIGKSRGPRPAGVVVAYTPDGRIDRSFGERGRVFFPARGDEHEYTGLKSIELQPDGKILVAGFRFGSLFVARLGPNGRLDRSFGGGTGMVRRFFGSRRFGCSRICWSATPVAVRPDGRIVVFVSNFPDGSRLLQFRPNGRLDPSFGRGGVALVATRLGFSLQGFDMVLQGDRIALAVWGEEPSPQNSGLLFSVARYLPDGQLDAGFGDNGVATHRARGFGAAFAALSQSGERLVVGGGSGEDRAGGGTDYYLELARFLPR